MFSRLKLIDKKNEYDRLKISIKGSLLILGIFLGPLAAKAIEVGEPLPLLKIPAMKGEEFTTNMTKGKVTLFNFWATWCEACKIELVEMEEQFKVFRNDKNVKLVFVNLDKDPRAAAAWAKQSLKNPQFFLESNYLDTGFDVSDQLKVDSFPMTLIVDGQGKVVYKQKGFTPGERLTEKLVQEVKNYMR